MDIKVREVTEKSSWENFVRSFAQQTNFLQSWNWGVCHEKLGIKIFRLGFYLDDKLTGTALLIHKKAKRGNYLECPGGPIFSWQDKTLLTEIFKTIKNIAKQNKCLFVRIRPQILNTRENQMLLGEIGFIKAPMHLHAQDTWVLDIKADDQTLLGNMRKTTRYLVRKAIKEGVKIEISYDLSDIKILFDLQKQTAKRHKFIPFSYEFFKSHFLSFLVDNQIAIFKGIYNKKILSIALIIFYANKAIYHYSASSDWAKVPVSYLLSWEAIREAKRRGCIIYDFWGIAPTDNPKHRFAGVTLFKKGFGGYKVSYLPAQDLPISAKYWFTYLFETGRRLTRNL